MPCVGFPCSCNGASSPFLAPKVARTPSSAMGPITSALGGHVVFPEPAMPETTGRGTMGKTPHSQHHSPLCWLHHSPAPTSSEQGWGSGGCSMAPGCSGHRLCPSGVLAGLGVQVSPSHLRRCSCVRPWGPIPGCRPPVGTRGAQPHQPTVGRGCGWHWWGAWRGCQPPHGGHHAGSSGRGSCQQPGAGCPAQAADILEGNSCSPLLPVARSLRNGRPGSPAVPAEPAWSRGPGAGTPEGTVGQSGA